MPSVARVPSVAKVAFVLCALALAAGLLAVRPATAASDQRQEFSAQRRPHIVIRPRYRPLSPYAKRYCRAWLAQENRLSGPVIVPRQYCWWQ